LEQDRSGVRPADFIRMGSWLDYDGWNLQHGVGFLARQPEDEVGPSWR